MSGRSRSVLLVLFSTYLVFLAATSLHWPMYQDTPIMLYAAFVIDRFGAVPYRDFFDNQMPGTYVVNLIVGRLSGYSETGVRLVDLSFLAVLLVTTFATMRRFGPMVAASAAVLFGVLYLASGEWMALQREFLLLLPLSAALWAGASPRWPPHVKALLVGGLMGTVATIKPHAALALPVQLWFVWHEARRTHPAGQDRAAGAVTVFVLGVSAFAVAPAAMVAILWRHGALPAFVDVVANYWPLYNELSGSPRPHVILAGGSRAWYVARHAVGLGIHPGLPLAVAAAIGGYRVLGDSSASEGHRRFVWLLVVLAVLSWVATAAAGKFYLYHWLPLNYFCILIASLGFMGRPSGRASTAVARDRRLVRVVLVLLCAGLPWRYGPFYRPFEFPFARVQEVSAELSARLRPGDAVAPLDWTEGAVHAMLLARAPLGVPFLYDFHLYHHVSSPYVQQLRRRVLAHFEQTPPRFIVRVPQVAFGGPDTETFFAELILLVERRYAKIVEGQGYEIWQLRDPVRPPEVF